MATPVSDNQTLNLGGVLSESKRIINAHSRHFLALSLLFLLPISFSLIIFPTLLSTLSLHPYFINKSTPQFLLLNTTNNKTLIPQLLFSIFISLLSISSIASITYSTLHGFYGRPVKLNSSIKSLLPSLPRLFSTLLASSAILLIISLSFILLFFSLSKLASLLGFDIPYESDCYNWLQLIVVVSFVITGGLFYVNCCLAFVVVVAESSWGFSPLWRSVKLVKGMRVVSMWLLLFAVITVVFPLWLSAVPLVNFAGGFDLWKSVSFVVLTVTNSGFAALFMLVVISGHAVLYMYCKALKGELAFEIAEEFAREYVSLPFDEDKVPHFVTVVQQAS